MINEEYNIDEVRCTKHPFGTRTKPLCNEPLMLVLEKKMGRCPGEFTLKLLKEANETLETEMGQYFKEITEENEDHYNEIDCDAKAVFSGMITGYAINEYIHKQELMYGELSKTAYADSFFTNKNEKITKGEYQDEVLEKFRLSGVNRILSGAAKEFTEKTVFINTERSELHLMGACIGYKLFDEEKVVKLNNLLSKGD